MTSPIPSALVEVSRPAVSDVKVSRATRSSVVGLLLAVAGVGILAAAPYWTGPGILRLLGEFLIYAALASLWNLLAGYAGLVSVGQQAFVGVGAYTVFGLAILYGVNPMLAVPVAGLVAALLAVPVAGLLFRLRDAYFAIGSWVVAEVFRLLAAQLSALGGGSGTSMPSRLVLAMARSRQAREFVSYWSALGLAVGVVALCALLLRSRYGMALTAMRDNEVAARSCGVDVRRIRLLVYVVSAAGTAMAGALIFLQRLRVSPDAAFSVNDFTALVIFMTVIGGIGSIEGPILGTILYFALRQTFQDFGSVYLIILGVVAIGTMLLFPRGLWGFVAARTGWQLLPLRRRLVRP